MTRELVKDEECVSLRNGADGQYLYNAISQESIPLSGGFLAECRLFHGSPCRPKLDFSEDETMP